MLILPALLYYFMHRSPREGTNEDYWSLRQNFIDEETNMGICRDVELTEKEESVNKIFLQHKLLEYDEGMEFPETFLAAKHFYDARDDIEMSNVFKFIKHIPKGCQLHVHDLGMVSSDFIYNLTYYDNLYISRDNGEINYKFFKKPDKTCNWELLSTVRSQPHLEKEVYKSLNIFKPEDAFENSNEIWKEFRNVFNRIRNIVTYRPVFEEFIYRSLQELYDDNIMYMEIRAGLPAVYDLQGNECGEVEVAGIYVDVIERFKRSHRYFLDAKLIYSPYRLVDNKTMDQYIETAAALKKMYPNFVIGFDLVGHEDEGRPLVDFIDILKKLDIDMYFHAGETNWFGTSVDRNLIDAILLGSKSIGNGFAILKHPKVLKAIKELDVPVEVCPISNQILKHVKDIRNHPGAVLMAHDYPVVIGSDDPGLWGATGLSYDWYYTIMGMASREADLKWFKKLAKNSIHYSGMGAAQKTAAFAMWAEEWEAFLDKILTQRWNRKS